MLKVVRYHARQLLFYLLSRPLSSHAKQAVIVEGPFTSAIQTMANVFYIRYVVVIVIQHTQVLRKVSLLL
jgi:hypothetical protein